VEASAKPDSISYSLERQFGDREMRRNNAVMRALNLKIRPDEITYLVEEVAKRHDQSEKPDFYTSMAILLHRYKGKKRAADRMFTISTRMHCLGELMKVEDARWSGWSKMTSDSGCVLAHQAIFEATALCPIRTDRERTYFEADEFFKLALERAVPEGNA
jgi:hypothetical protein